MKWFKFATGGWGLWLAGIWFIVYGAVHLLKLEFSYRDQAMALLAVVAGVLIVLRR
jgi:hypothetical protein